MQFAELAPPGCKDFGLARRVVLIAFWIFNDTAAQSAKKGTWWAETLQSDAERLARRMSSFQGGSTSSLTTTRLGVVCHSSAQR